jgi:uncharacterized protein
MRLLVENLIRKLVEDLKSKGSVIVAFSGGVDSSVVAALAYKALNERALAVTVNSPLLPSHDFSDAKKVAEKIGIKHLIVQSNELDLPGFADNPPNRCYLCKKSLFKLLRKMAADKGFQVVADGTNISDLDEHRPGLLARKEENIYSPLLENRLNKEDVRQIAFSLGLPIADKPSSPCLASRFPYGSRISIERLRRVDAAEAYIRSKLKVKTVRVRDHEDLARIEVGRTERYYFFSEEVMEDVAQKLKNLGYKFVTLDLEGYKLGCFDADKSKQNRFNVT